MNKIKLNEEISEFIGAFIGDGYLGSSVKGKNQYLIGFAGHKELDEHYYLNTLIPIIKRNFSFATPHLRYRTDENTLMLRIYSKTLYKFMLKLDFIPGKKAMTVKIPSEIIKNKKFMSATTRGIFDTDGCIFWDKRKIYRKAYPRITLQMSSKQLIEQLEQYLSKNFSLYVNKSDKNHKYCVEIYGVEQLERFLKEIGFSNTRHLNKIICLRSSAVER